MPRLVVLAIHQTLYASHLARVQLQQDQQICVVELVLLLCEKRQAWLPVFMPGAAARLLNECRLLLRVSGKRPCVGTTEP